MHTHLKIFGFIYDRMIVDLSRRHPIAAERVGFAYARSSRIGRKTDLYVFDYEPVADGDYIDDPTVGARINSAAIRRAMQGILDRGASCFHVHQHRGSGRPHPSSVDLEGNVPIAQGFVRMRPDRIHGTLILSNDGANASGWAGLSYEPVEVGEISVVGFPYRFLWRGM